MFTYKLDEKNLKLKGNYEMEDGTVITLTNSWKNEEDMNSELSNVLNAMETNFEYAKNNPEKIQVIRSNLSTESHTKMKNHKVLGFKFSTVVLTNHVWDEANITLGLFSIVVPYENDKLNFSKLYFKPSKKVLFGFGGKTNAKGIYLNGF